MNHRLTLTLALGLAGTAALAQHPLVRTDEIEMKRIGALATVQRLGISHRTPGNRRVAVSAPGERGCTFNIGDIESAREDDLPGSPGSDRAHRGLRRNQYLTIVDDSPICVQR